MAIQLDRIDDKSDGFTVDFTVTNKYRRTFPANPGRDQMAYARECVQSIVEGPVEKPEGVKVVPPTVTAVEDPNKVIVLDEVQPAKPAVEAQPALEAEAQPTETEQPSRKRNRY